MGCGDAAKQSAAIGKDAHYGGAAAGSSPSVYLPGAQIAALAAAATTPRVVVNRHPVKPTPLPAIKNITITLTEAEALDLFAVLGQSTHMGWLYANLSTALTR